MSVGAMVGVGVLVMGVTVVGGLDGESDASTPVGAIDGFIEGEIVGLAVVATGIPVGVPVGELLGSSVVVASGSREGDGVVGSNVVGDGVVGSNVVGDVVGTMQAGSQGPQVSGYSLAIKPQASASVKLFSLCKNPMRSRQLSNKERECQIQQVIFMISTKAVQITRCQLT